ncbi:MAG: hemolysin III family protein [Clostridia bacterium]|nr:hemolysin III family protein [Clostridia bacterium]
MDIISKSVRAEYKIKKRSAKAVYKDKKKAAKSEYTSKPEIGRKPKPASPSDPPRRSVIEEVGNAVTHGVGAILSVIAYAFTLRASEKREEVFSATVYFAGLFLLFSMSCLYHSFRSGSKVKRLFRRFDYSSIYLLIGATYTPILLCFLGGAYGKIFCAAQWAVIAAGVTFICVFGPERFKKIHFALYIALGWSALLFLPETLSANLAFSLWILFGGVIYSLGIIPFVIKGKAAHFLWHFFVLAGAAVQWVGIYVHIFLA